MNFRGGPRLQSAEKIVADLNQRIGSTIHSVSVRGRPYSSLIIGDANSFAPMNREAGPAEREYKMLLQPNAFQRADAGRVAGRESGAELRILIADQYEVVRIGLKSVLESRKGWHVVAEAENGADAVAQASKAKPEIAIVDSALPLINGTEATRQIRARSPETEVLIFAAYQSDALVNDALHAGARAILLKSDVTGDLIAAIESLAIRRPFFAGKFSEQLLQIFLSSQCGRPDWELSPRERTVVQLIAEGHSNKQISSILNLSVKTVETHRAAAMRKLDIGSIAGLVRYAIRNRIIEA